MDNKRKYIEYTSKANTRKEIESLIFDFKKNIEDWRDFDIELKNLQLKIFEKIWKILILNGKLISRNNVLNKRIEDIKDEYFELTQETLFKDEIIYSQKEEIFSLKQENEDFLFRINELEQEDWILSNELKKVRIILEEKNKQERIFKDQIKNLRKYIEKQKEELGDLNKFKTWWNNEKNSLSEKINSLQLELDNLIQLREANNSNYLWYAKNIAVSMALIWSFLYNWNLNNEKIILEASIEDVNNELNKLKFINESISSEYISTVDDNFYLSSQISEKDQSISEKNILLAEKSEEINEYFFNSEFSKAEFLNFNPVKKISFLTQKNSDEVEKILEWKEFFVISDKENVKKLVSDITLWEVLAWIDIWSVKIKNPGWDFQVVRKNLEEDLGDLWAEFFEWDWDRWKFLSWAKIALFETKEGIQNQIDNNLPVTAISDKFEWVEYTNLSKDQLLKIIAEEDESWNRKFLQLTSPVDVYWIDKKLVEVLAQLVENFDNVQVYSWRRSLSLDWWEENSKTYRLIREEEVVLWRGLTKDEKYEIALLSWWIHPLSKAFDIWTWDWKYSEIKAYLKKMWLYTYYHHWHLHVWIKQSSDFTESERITLFEKNGKRETLTSVVKSPEFYYYVMENWIDSFLEKNKFLIWKNFSNTDFEYMKKYIKVTKNWIEWIKWLFSDGYWNLKAKYDFKSFNFAYLNSKDKWLWYKEYLAMAKDSKIYIVSEENTADKKKT